jgi:hypothetical protein
MIICSHYYSQPKSYTSSHCWIIPMFCGSPTFWALVWLANSFLIPTLSASTPFWQNWGSKARAWYLKLLVLCHQVVYPYNCQVSIVEENPEGFPLNIRFIWFELQTMPTHAPCFKLNAFIQCKEKQWTFWKVMVNAYNYKNLLKKWENAI